MGGVASRRVNSKQAPSSLKAFISPPYASTTFLAMASPIPVSPPVPLGEGLEQGGQEVFGDTGSVVAYR